MKSKYIAIPLIIVLISGLISCSSDDTDHSTAPTDEVNVEVKNLDETIQKIKDTKTLRVSSYISLEGEAGPVAIKRLQASTSCKTNFQQEILFQEINLEEVTAIPVKDILPSQVFSPSNNPNRQVICSVEVNLFRETLAPIRILLTDVKIKHTDSYINHHLSFLRKGEDNFFLKSDLAGDRLQFPSKTGEVETLCESSWHRNFFGSENISISELFPNSLFEQNNFESCRILVRDDKTKEIWLSDTFYIQNKKSKLKHFVSTSFQGDSEVDYINDVVLSITLANQGDVDSYFKVQFPKTTLSIMPVYIAKSDNIARHNGTYSIPVSWRIAGGEIHKKSKTISNRIYKLRPGQSIRFELLANARYSCTVGINFQGFKNGTQTLQPNCNVHRVLPMMGLNNIIRKFPQISDSVFSQAKGDRWRKLNLLPEKKYQLAKDFIFWTPNTGISKHCSPLRAPKSIGKKVHKLVPSYGHRLTCN